MNEMHKKKRFVTAGLFATVAVFLLSILPVLYLSGVDRASGDDWGYGLLTHRAWLETHSPGKVMEAALLTVRNYYESWQGTWFSVFLFTLQPEVFSFEMYWIVPYIMLGLLTGSVSWFLYEIIVRFWHMDIKEYLLVDITILTLLIQFAPNKKSAIFWYNGAAHYVVPFALAMFSIGCFMRFVQAGKSRYVIWATVWMTLLGGTNYLAAILGCLGFLFLGVVFFQKSRKVLWMAVPLAFEVTGLLVSALAPGNARRGGESYEITAGRMLWAVWESFRQGIMGVFQFVKEYPITLAVMILLAVILWDVFGELVQREHLRFPLPGLVIFYFFGTYCAMYWPVVFAGVEVSGGVPDTIYWVLVLMLLCSMMYGIGWLAEKQGRLGENKLNNGRYLYVAGITAAFVIMVLGRSNIRDATAYVCMEYIVSGEARDYKAQMEQFTLLLTDDSVEEVVLPFINDWQGPLMHMPVTMDPKAWTNQVVKDFFGKRSVVAIPRPEWEENQIKNE